MHRGPGPYRIGLATFGRYILDRGLPAFADAYVEAVVDHLHIAARRSGRCRPRSLNAGEFRRFETAIVKLKYLLDCHPVAGDFDYFREIRLRDMTDFNRLHAEKLIGLPGVRQTHAFFVMKELVDDAQSISEVYEEQSKPKPDHPGVLNRDGQLWIDTVRPLRVSDTMADVVPFSGQPDAVIAWFKC